MPVYLQEINQHFIKILFAYLHKFSSVIQPSHFRNGKHLSVLAKSCRNRIPEIILMQRMQIFKSLYINRLHLINIIFLLFGMNIALLLCVQDKIGSFNLY